MADGRDSWRNGPEAAQLRREFREEARKLRDELREEFIHQMAEQTASLRAQREARGPFGRGRGPGRPRGKLTRDAIIDVAMAIMNKRGLNRVTMRAIAHELDTGPASIYAHVSSMAELHGHMLDRIIGRIDVAPADGTWQERVTQLLHGLSRAVLTYPDLARSALEVRPVGHNTLAFADQLLGLLEEGGIDERRRALGVDLLLLWTMGGAAEHAVDVQDPTGPSESIRQFREAIADGDAYPHLHAARESLFFGDEDVRFRWGVNALLTGIAQSREPGTI